MHKPTIEEILAPKPQARPRPLEIRTPKNIAKYVRTFYFSQYKNRSKSIVSAYSALDIKEDSHEYPRKKHNLPLV